MPPRTHFHRDVSYEFLLDERLVYEAGMKEGNAGKDGSRLTESPGSTPIIIRPYAGVKILQPMFAGDPKPKS
jgi:hypothetical protein